MRTPIFWRSAQDPSSIRNCGPARARRDSEFQSAATWFRRHPETILFSAAPRGRSDDLKESSRSRDAPASTRDACAPQTMRTPQLFAESLAELCARVFAVELRDETGADLGGTHCFALVGVGAITKSLVIHYLHHFQHPSLAFGCALRQKRKVRNFRSRKKHCRSVRARRRARAAADARRCFHCQVCVVFRNED